MTTKIKSRIIIVSCMVIASFTGSFAQKLQTYSVTETRQLISQWAANPKKVAEEVMKKYGAPNIVGSNILVWNNNGPWKRTILHKEEAPHNFPKVHTDMLEQFIDYTVPPEKFSDLAMYDGSVVAQRTVGEMSARCDKEEMNFLALNLANDVAQGKKTVEEARDYYTKAVMAFMKGQMDPYVTGLKFTVPKGGTGDPDKKTIMQ